MPQAAVGDETTLHIAVHLGALDLVRILLAGGADMKAKCRGETLTHLGSCNGSLVLNISPVSYQMRNDISSLLAAHGRARGPRPLT